MDERDVVRSVIGLGEKPGNEALDRSFDLRRRQRCAEHGVTSVNYNRSNYDPVNLLSSARAT